MSSDVNLEQELAAFDKEFQDAQPMDNWMPPDGEYIVDVGETKTNIRVDKTTKQKVADIKLYGIIRPDCVAGDLSVAGQGFQIGWWSPKNFGMLKAALRILNGGEPWSGGITDAVKFLQNSKNLPLKVKVARRQSDKGEFANVSILELVRISHEVVPTITGQGMAPVEVP